ncbi:MAG: hypothetical protein IJ736_02355 [Firmicutes bacterium]|nr:hypothetical protein [Bacillota bacterium]
MKRREKILTAGMSAWLFGILSAVSVYAGDTSEGSNETVMTVLLAINMVLAVAVLIAVIIAIKKISEINVPAEKESENEKQRESIEDKANEIKEYADKKISAIEKKNDEIYSGIEDIKKALAYISEDMNKEEAKSESTEEKAEEDKSSEKQSGKKTIEGIYTGYLNKKADVPKQMELKKLHIEEGDVRFSNSESDGVDCYIYIKKHDKNNNDIDVKAYIFPERAMMVERGEAGYSYYEDIYDIETGKGRIELVKPCSAVANINGRFEKIQRGLIYLP